MKLNFHEEIRRNKIKSAFLIIFFMIFAGVLGVAWGWYIGSPTTGLVVTAVIAFIYALISWFSGSAMLLALSGAKEANRTHFAKYINTVEGLAIAAGIPNPKAYVIDTPALNAFATGRDPQHAAVTVTTGLLQKLDHQELEGVVAHEIAHIKNYDIRIMMLAAILVGIVTLLSDIMFRTFIFGGGRKDRDGKMTIVIIVVAVLLAILAPLVAQFIRLAISRQREYLADAHGAKLTRYPEGLASALEKIKGDHKPEFKGTSNANAHLFISSPFSKSKKFLARMFATHPPIDERIKKLRAM
ncbi:MAG: heat shock protein HtpX [Candidatus Woesearchaeota archaeon]|jgi:heat shock protein HtpX